jgi:hypothetical protein
VLEACAVFRPERVRDAAASRHGFNPIWKRAWSREIGMVPLVAILDDFVRPISGIVRIWRLFYPNSAPISVIIATAATPSYAWVCSLSRLLPSTVAGSGGRRSAGKLRARAWRS